MERLHDVLHDRALWLLSSEAEPELTCPDVESAFPVPDDFKGVFKVNQGRPSSPARGGWSRPPQPGAPAWRKVSEGRREQVQRPVSDSGPSLVWFP